MREEREYENNCMTADVACMGAAVAVVGKNVAPMQVDGQPPSDRCKKCKTCFACVCAKSRMYHYCYEAQL